MPLRHKTFIIQLYNSKCKARHMQSKVVWVRLWTQAQYMRRQCQSRQCLHGKVCTIKEVMFSRLQSIINEVKYSPVVQRLGLNPHVYVHFISHRHHWPNMDQPGHCWNAQCSNQCMMIHDDTEGQEAVHSSELWMHHLWRRFQKEIVRPKLFHPADACHTLVYMWLMALTKFCVVSVTFPWQRCS